MVRAHGAACRYLLSVLAILGALPASLPSLEETLRGLFPFVDEDHAIHQFFLPYHYAISIPAVLLVLLFTGSATFIGMVMIKSQKKKKHD
ncbi:hypothetical protein BBJ28_00018360 [Nothophytophthora sp. Chile5]|nr:hypothetical protein BBJ28_00018360 [Nothophytophthora sp. Chile5]